MNAEVLDEGRLVRLLSDLVAIESVNPAYGGGHGEAQIADYVEAHCRRLGLDVWRQPRLPGRDNVLAALTVPGATLTVLLEAHLDTVGLEPMGERALRPRVEGGRLYGRGACDTKGSLAAMLGAIELLLARRAELGANVVLLAAVDEEHHYRGVLTFLDSGYPIQAAVVGEPTDLRVVIAHKGCVRWRLSTIGRAAHSSRPEEGNSAIWQMVEVLRALHDLETQLGRHAHPLVGSPTLNVGRIWGGRGVNVVPDRCTVEVDRRIIPGEDPTVVLAEIDELMAELRGANPAIAVERKAPFVVDWALDTPAEAEVVRAAVAACRLLDLPAEPIGVPYGTDASKLSVLGRVPSIVFGPGSIDQAHGADEFVPVPQLLAAARIYAAIVAGMARNQARRPGSTSA